MQLTESQLMTVATWFGVYANEIEPCSYEYELMSKLAMASGHYESAQHYLQKYHEALEYERIAEEEWKAEEQAEANFT